MEKIKYEFDPHNRLIAESAFRGIRKVLDGQFKISAHNLLTYHVKTPFPADIKAPHQLKLRGTWSLTEDHQLRLTLDQWRRPTFGDQLTLRGEILDVKKNSLLFAVKTRTKDGLPSMYLIELAGAWQANAQNRLTFRVNKENNGSDALNFEGSWQVDENYQIIYRYFQKQLTRKVKEIHTLTFQGYWDIQDKTRLSFVLDVNSDSRFDFNTTLGIFKDNYIKYELGVGLSSVRQPAKQTVTFFGRWQIKKNIGLVFAVEREGRQIQQIVFGAQAKLANTGAVSFYLRNSLNQDIGAELKLSRDMFGGDGQAFLRLLKEKRELAILVGAGWRW
ncbi:MAG: hypothetical protein Q8N85_02600 [Candidatus Omnitrophota bacterium]|nr:hypothetical protein [Candidatus Omnitrophota bacterium]